MKNKLHLIALNIPFPPDYGGAIDIFYKIKSLHGLGLEIILHCFKYNRSQNIELNKYCTEVFYYERKNRAIDFFSSLPFIVKTRNHPQLLENILNNPAPILFDGLHTCHYLNNAKLASLTKIVRTHNIEHEYYLALTKSTNSLFHRFFFNREAKKLKNFEKVLEHANALACISPEDKSYFDNKYGNAFFIPAFHPYEKNVSLKGRGDYILFHGNLSVAENRKALDFILNEVL
ncbi:MAG: hypothetical protein U9R19_06950 [Bacteroidota bacterium]|nr:hypothetical protein [Bacteroidota bacterium]